LELSFSPKATIAVKAHGFRCDAQLGSNGRIIDQVRDCEQFLDDCQMSRRHEIDRESEA
jgi:hypothetical protein